jgi:hypothetical protein
MYQAVLLLTMSLAMITALRWRIFMLTTMQQATQPCQRQWLRQSNNPRGFRFEVSSVSFV